METTAISRYKKLIKDIRAVFSVFLSYKNTDPIHYKQLVKNWGLDEVCSLLSEVEAFNVEDLRHELYCLDGKPLKRVIDDLRCYLPNYSKMLFVLDHYKVLFSLLEDIHGGKNAHLIIDNLVTIGITATKTKISRVALLLDELRPKQRADEIQQEPSGERAKKAFKKAVEAGYMEKTATGYKWLFKQNQRGHKVSFGYFVFKVYNYDIPQKSLARLFGFKRIDSDIARAIDSKKTQKWRKEIDELFATLD